MAYTGKDHTFIVCAYGDSPFLEECIISLRDQSVKSAVLLATSTPSDYIREIAGKYGIPVFENPGGNGIAADWNFAASCGNTPLITIAHQDDVYFPDYTETMLSCMNRAKNPLFFQSNYAELRNGKEVYSNTLLNIKRVMRFPIWLFPSSVFMRRLSLAFGNPYMIPTVTFLKDVIDRYPFTAGMRSNLDWQQWERLSRVKGSFVNTNRVLLFHRIHEDSETSHTINGRIRAGEDYEMFLKFWPEKTARAILKVYLSGENSNSI